MKGAKNLDELEKQLSSVRLELMTKMSNISLKLQDTKILISSYEDALDKRIDSSWFYTSGYGNLDEAMTVGFSPGHITVVAGRTGMGKSAFVSNMALRLSEKNVPVAYFSLEMSAMSVFDRIMAIKTIIPIHRFTKSIKELNEIEYNRIRENLDKLRENRYLYLSDFPRMSLSSIASQIEKWKKLNNFKTAVCIIDLFGQLTDIDSKNTAVSYEFALREAKILSMELNIHFILVAQIKRTPEKGKNLWNKRPSLEDLKHSGGFEEVASIVMLIFRGKYYDKNLSDDILEINIAKQREGISPIDKFFIFNPEFTLITPTTLLPYDRRLQ